jgi:hypothetical protein
VRFLKQIFGYTALRYAVDRVNFQLSTYMVCLCKYHNSIANLFSLAFIYLLFIYLLVSPYYNTQNYNKNKNNIHDYRQGEQLKSTQQLKSIPSTPNF